MVPAGATEHGQLLRRDNALPGTTGTMVGTGIDQWRQSIASPPRRWPWGTHSITGVYSGDSNYNGATSSVLHVQVIVSVADFTVTSTTGPQLIPPGASANYIITAVTQAVNGTKFTNVVTMTAANLPPGSSYSFTPTSVTPPPQQGATSIFSVSVHIQIASHGVSKTPFVLAILLLPLAPL